MRFYHFCRYLHFLEPLLLNIKQKQECGPFNSLKFQDPVSLAEPWVSQIKLIPKRCVSLGCGFFGVILCTSLHENFLEVSRLPSMTLTVPWPLYPAAVTLGFGGKCSNRFKCQPCPPVSWLWPSLFPLAIELLFLLWKDFCIAADTLMALQVP